MKIVEEENRIFDSWKMRLPNLIPDGVVNENAYRSINPKLLFLLKEPNTKETGWNLIDFIQKGAQASTWDNIVRWTIGIRNFKKEIPWSELLTISAEQRKETLQSVVVMNLKKTPGGQVTDDKKLFQFVSENCEFLVEQFLLYTDHQSTHITICCGSQVTNLFNQFISVAPQDWQHTFNGIPFREYRPNQFVIAYAHPEARVADNILYYPLINAVKEILTKQGVGYG